MVTTTVTLNIESFNLRRITTESSNVSEVKPQFSLHAGNLLLWLAFAITHHFEWAVKQLVLLRYLVKSRLLRS